MLEVKKLGSFSLASKSGKFPLFDNFFLNLANFWDLNNFQNFDNFPIFDNFSYFSIDSSPPSTLSTSLAANTSLTISICYDIIVFIINISDAAILLKS